jgi:hypothetical protein
MYVKVKPRDCFNLISSGCYQGLTRRLLSEGFNFHKTRETHGAEYVCFALPYLPLKKKRAKYYSITILRVV